jgi:hypothetical protein
MTRSDIRHHARVAGLKAKHACLQETIVALHHARITELKAKHARLEETIVALQKKMPDWLLYLPRKAGGPQFMRRACTYLETMRARLESEGCKMWLDANHDCVSRVFLISKFRGMDGGVFCSGEWTPFGRKHRDTYRGVSPDNIVFAGDPDLLAEKYTPPCLHLGDAPAHVQARARSIQSRGLAGAVCLAGMTPAYGVSGIYRLDEITSRAGDDRVGDSEVRGLIVKNAFF